MEKGELLKRSGGGGGTAQRGGGRGGKPLGINSSFKVKMLILSLHGANSFLTGVPKSHLRLREALTCRQWGKRVTNRTPGFGSASCMSAKLLLLSGPQLLHHWKSLQRTFQAHISVACEVFI